MRLVYLYALLPGFGEEAKAPSWVQFPVDMSDRPPQANQPDRGVYIIYITRVSSIDIR